MKHIPVIIVGLIAAGAFGGGYFLAKNRAETKRIAALEIEVADLRKVTANQHRLLADLSNVDWEAWKKLDPINRKHRIIALWYSSQDVGNYYLGLETGHKWGPVWNRRSPISILEEQTEVMREFLKDLRKLEEASPHPPMYPTEDHRDPADGSRIDWENHITVGNQANPRVIWYGKSKKRGDWMAYESEKGVYAPDSELLQKIIDHKRTEDEKQVEDDEADPFSGGK